MKIRISTILVLLVSLFVAVFLFVRKNSEPINTANFYFNDSMQNNISKQLADNTQQTLDNNQKQTIDPIENAKSRITKKPFGIYITPKTSLVQPEKFQGYHTGADLETTPAEQNADVSVVALCSGELLMAKNASGYGGVVVESCVLDGKAVTVIYGHINLSSMKNKVGDQLKVGDFLAFLGKGFSVQTDRERKHLHLGIHLGNSMDILGYVQNKSQLSGWLDPANYL